MEKMKKDRIPGRVFAFVDVHGKRAAIWGVVA